MEPCVEWSGTVTHMNSDGGLALDGGILRTTLIRKAVLKEWGAIPYRNRHVAYGPIPKPLVKLRLRALTSCVGSRAKLTRAVDLGRGHRTAIARWTCPEFNQGVRRLSQVRCVRLWARGGDKCNEFGLLTLVQGPVERRNIYGYISYNNGICDCGLICRELNNMVLIAQTIGFR